MRVFVLDDISIPMPRLRNAVFVEWEQICHRKDWRVFIRYSAYRHTSRHVSKARKRPFIVAARNWETIAACTTLEAALKSAIEYLTVE